MANNSEMQSIRASQDVDEGADSIPENTVANSTAKGMTKRMKDNVNRPRDNVILRLPKDRGLTGHALRTGKVQMIQDGEYNQGFAVEIDNSVGSPHIANCMIGPCYDNDGQLRGVVQLINKCNNEAISFQDEREFENLLTTVGEIIKQADEVKFVGDLSCNLNVQLTQTADNILESARIFEERDIQSLGQACD